MAALYINGESFPLPDDPRTTLLDFLHQNLSMFGTKKGCDHGQCGACTVIVNGRRMNACLLLAFQLKGKHITTIEGIGQADDLHPLQQAFIDKDAFQCGYCTSGQLCSGVALLNELKEREPSIVSTQAGATPREDIAERMSGNLCRCGAYPNIVEAIEQVIVMEGEK